MATYLDVLVELLHDPATRAAYLADPALWLRDSGLGYLCGEDVVAAGALHDVMEAIVGDIDKSGRFAFETHLDVPLAEKHGAAKGCTIVRRDLASGTLASSSKSLAGKLTYAYGAMSDSDCSEFITGTNGSPVALPCSMTYALTGALIE